MNYPVSYFINKHFYTENKQNWVLRQTKSKFDYAVLGASRVFNMIDVKSLDSTFGKKGINIGTSGSCYAENYLILSEFTSKNNISTLILNIDEFSFNSAKSYTYPFHDYEYLPIFNKYERIFADYIPAWKYYLWKTIPVAKYFEYNDQFFLKNINSTLWNKTNGSELLLPINRNIIEFKYNTRQKKLDEIDIKYFYKIIDLCEARKIKLLFITTPIYGSISKMNSPLFLKYVKADPRSSRIPYYNYDQFIDPTNMNFFIDNTHTNSEGSITYSRNLGKKLKEDNQ